ncbi:hypothetical protein [Oceanobacillus massiliensis]|uniref:hypothetical protein n=1 Tax=Oceanobacillus massiliensis TaxID=1465765 RepID=UPI00301867DA
MSIFKINGEMAKVLQTQQSLRPGQIVQGKILKLYPDNKAQIQLGGQKLIAQLEASLTIDNRYHFQVQSSDEMIHLKVLSEQVKGQSQMALEKLMDQLGIKSSKGNSSFIQAIVNANIPYDREQVSRALQILDTVKDKGKAQQILIGMIARRLPVTENVFQALYTKQSSNFSHQLSEMLQQLKSRSTSELSMRIEQLIEPPLSEKMSLIRQVIADNSSNSQQLFQIVKHMGMILQNVDFQTWKSEWKQMEPLLADKVNTPPLQEVKLPFQLNHSTVLQALEQVNSNKQMVLAESQELLKIWGSKLNQATSNGAVLTQSDFVKLRDDIAQKIAPLLAVDQGQSQRIISNDLPQLERLLTMLETFSKAQTFAQLNNTLASINLDKLFMLHSPKDQFMQQLNQILRFTGLSYESQIATNTLEENQSIKSMLIQFVQQGEGVMGDKAAQLTHFINGMQLNSVNESANFIQAALQVPAEKLGLKQDMELEFESRKTADGKIDPDYCRILFYLDLEQLKETVIDMHIQKRSVSVTIYNDVQDLKRNTVSIQPVLSQGLKTLNYHLSSVHFKPLQEQQKDSKNVEATSFQPTYQGVDYRI